MTNGLKFKWNPSVTKEIEENPTKVYNKINCSKVKIKNKTNIVEQ